MKALSLTIGKEAEELVRKQINWSAVPNPVVQLIRQGDRRPVNPEWGEAYLGGADKKTLEELFHKLHDRDVKSTHWRIVPAVFPRDEFPAEVLFEVCGIAFAFWPLLARKIDGGRLDLEQNGLVLKDASGALVDPFPRGRHATQDR